MKKQGMPMSLQDLGIDRKRKSNDRSQKSSKKRRTSDEDDSEPTKLVKLDRALRQERQEKDQRKQKKKKQKLVNPDAQITVPPVLQMPAGDDDIEEEVDDIEEMDMDDAEMNQANLSSDELEELAAAELSDASSDSVVDSNDEAEPSRRIFSSDEDSDALENLEQANIVGLSRTLDKEQAQMEEEAEAELEDAALQTNIVEESGLPDDPLQNPLTPNLQLLRTRITETIRILGNTSKLADKSKSRSEYTQSLLADISLYYGYTPYLAEKLFSLFSPSEAFAFFESNETPRPLVLRTNTLRTTRRQLAQSLINRGVTLEPVGKWSKVGLQVFESPVPLGATPEYLAGHYMIQAASSFLPVMALAPQPGERVLDMASAPGGKTTHMAALMRNTGIIFANDANRQRAKGLIGNIHRLGVKNTIVCAYEAQKAFPKTLAGFDRVLLDAPCSGTGVIGKDPSVKTSKTERDFLALPHMQKQLLLSAIDSVDHASKTGGYIVYSTCSVTVEENEGVVQYVLRKRPNVTIADTGLGSFGSPGFTSYESKKFDDKMNLTRRYFPHRENVDGFFVCKLKKTGPTPTNAAGEIVNGPTKSERSSKSKSGSSATNTEDSENGGVSVNGGDDFGGFDSDEDKNLIEKGRKNDLRKRGLDPKSVGVNGAKKMNGVEKKEKVQETVTETTEDDVSKPSKTEKTKSKSNGDADEKSKKSKSKTTEKNGVNGTASPKSKSETKTKSKSKSKSQKA